ncbi:MAG: thioredoxin [Chlorobiaceae bacterium]|nr:thioredoxin [Chlorobiaceae bacterium]MBA4309421.1 thioredoxin [Chlorobiaceae bacterium]
MLQVIDVELTPNPHALKFILNEKLLKHETRQFHNKEAAASDPLAKIIFDLPGVVTVFYMDKFITIEKTKETQWGQIQRPLLNLLKDFDTNVIPPEVEPKGDDENSSEMLKQINDILNQKVRPALAFDGGGLEILGLEGYTLKVRYQGACGSCPSAIRGTLTSIESLLKRDVNQAIQVIPA